MKITITDGNMLFHTIQIDDNETAQNIKALAEAQTNIPMQRIVLMHQGKQIPDQKKMNQIGVKDGDMLLIRVSQPKMPMNNQYNNNQNKPKLGIAAMIKQFDKNVKNSINQFNIPKKDISQFRPQAERIKGQILYDHQRLAQLQKKDPQIAKALHSQNIDDLANLLMKRRDERIQKMINQQKKFHELAKNPMDPQYQRMLQQRIHQQNIDKNMQFANQYIPQVFGRVTMLYINAKVNKVPIQAFVDSGAQTTIMSQSLANKCGLMRLVDKRQEGMAVGVGTCKILGKIHAADIEIQGKIITCSFTVIQNNSVQFLLGLDMLKRFSCIMNLKENTLNFQNGMIITKFLGQGQIIRNKQEQPIPVDIEQKVKKLKAQGFNHMEALGALKSSNYNQQLARNLLLQKKFGK